MGYSKRNYKKKIYSDISLCKETRKFSNKQCNFAPTGTRERKNEVQSQKKEENNKDQSGNK